MKLNYSYFVLYKGSTMNELCLYLYFEPFCSCVPSLRPVDPLYYAKYMLFYFICLNCNILQLVLT